MGETNHITITMVITTWHCWWFLCSNSCRRPEHSAAEKHELLLVKLPVVGWLGVRSASKKWTSISERCDYFVSHYAVHSAVQTFVAQTLQVPWLSCCLHGPVRSLASSQAAVVFAVFDFPLQCISALHSAMLLQSVNRVQQVNIVSVVNCTVIS